MTVEPSSSARNIDAGQVSGREQESSICYLGLTSQPGSHAVVKKKLEKASRTLLTKVRESYSSVRASLTPRLWVANKHHAAFEGTVPIARR